MGRKWNIYLGVFLLSVNIAIWTQTTSKTAHNT